MKDILKRAEILMEALPYIKAYHGKTVVVKYGGGVMTDNALKKSIASDIALMKYVGISPVIIHGGGPDITAFMNRLGLPVEFVGGLRRTSAEAIEVVKMVLIGKVNKEIVGRLNSHGKMALGLSGDDGGLITAQKRSGEPDLGFVGEVTDINRAMLVDLIEDGFIPVIASIGAGEDGASYNINADTVAAEVAKALVADKIIFLTDVEGLYENPQDAATLVSEASVAECEALVKAGHLQGGMLPKVKGCITALRAGVERAHILNGTTPHALLLEIFTDEGVGTMITS